MPKFGDYPELTSGGITSAADVSVVVKDAQGAPATKYVKLSELQTAIGSGSGLSTATTQSLQTNTTAADGDMVLVNGYYTAGDGVVLWYRWNAASTATPDGVDASHPGLIIQPTGVSGAGRWIAQDVGLTRNVRWYGAKGDNAQNDAPYINAACQTSCNVFLPNGYYKTDSTIVIKSYMSFEGESRSGTTIRYTGTDWAIKFDINNFGFRFGRFTLTRTVAGDGIPQYNGILVSPTSGAYAGTTITNGHFYDLIITYYAIGLQLGNSGICATSENELHNLSISNCLTAVKVTDYNTLDNVFLNLGMSYVNKCIECVSGGGETHVISGSVSYAGYWNADFAAFSFLSGGVYSVRGMRCEVCACRLFATATGATLYLDTCTSSATTGTHTIDANYHTNVIALNCNFDKPVRGTYHTGVLEMNGCVFDTAVSTPSSWVDDLAKPSGLGELRLINCFQRNYPDQNLTRIPDYVSAATAGIDLRQKWNDAGQSFEAITTDITDTTSASTSNLLNLKIGGTSKAKITKGGVPTFAGDTLTLEAAKTPASATATGTTGMICWDASYLYICTATNTWRRVAHSTW